MAQEGESTPPSVTTNEPQASPTPKQDASPQPQATATPKRSMTVGEALGLTVEAPKSESSGDSGETELNFPDRDKPTTKWAEKDEVGKSTFFDKLVEVTWTLGITSLLIWGSAKLAARAGFKQIGASSAPKSMIEIIERKRLSPGRSILLMRVGPKVLAVAATEGGYETLTEFEEEEFKRYQDQLPGAEPKAPDGEPPDGVTTPADIARHYLSIIPGTGAKK